MDDQIIDYKLNNTKSLNIDNSPKDERYAGLRDYVAELYPNPPPPGLSYPPIPPIVRIHNYPIQENISKVEEIDDQNEKYDILLSETRFSTIVEYEEVEDIKIVDEIIENSNLSTPECEVNLKEQNLNKIEKNENLETKLEENYEELPAYNSTESNRETENVLKIISGEKEIVNDFQVVDDERRKEIDKNVKILEEIVSSIPGAKIIEKHSPLSYPNPPPQGFEYPVKPAIIYKEDIKESKVSTVDITNLDKNIVNNIENEIVTTKPAKPTIKLLPPEIEHCPRSPVILMQPSIFHNQLHRIEEEIEPGNTFSTFKGGEIEDFNVGESKKKYCCNIFCC